MLQMSAEYEFVQARCRHVHRVGGMCTCRVRLIIASAELARSPLLNAVGCGVEASRQEEGAPGIGLALLLQLKRTC